jgi:hypothetical protein
MASLPVEEIIKVVSILETDAYRLYELIESCYRKDFFEKVFLKNYGYLINENAEPNFSRSLEAIKDSCQ